ncbi:MAG: sensor histidine kinase [Actinobacteria bacterium]|nr:MAG: sensor histidine kinase [Actinomycetota bacterium]
MVERIWLLARRYWFDALVVAGAIEALVELFTRQGDKNAPTSSLWILAPLLVAGILPLLARRWFPFGAPAAVFLINAVVSFIDGRVVTLTAATFLTVLVSAFLFGMLEHRTQAVAGLAIGLAAGVVVTRNDPSQSASDFVGLGVFFGAVWLIGFVLGRKGEKAAAAELRAERLEREREVRAREAVAEERARIARELHDVVGHSVSVMTVQASAVRRLLKPEQEREREALEVVEQTGREALAEMRRLVGVLRRPEEAPALAPQPSLEHLDRLVAKARESGLPVELRIEGTPSPLPPGVDLTAYRLVQEGLTNTIKHARASRAGVVVRYGEGEVEIFVTDDGDGGGDGGGGGHGLVGMRERVSVYGGELEAGPSPGGGYGLRARLPLG